MKLEDLTPKQDPKAGVLSGGDYGGGKIPLGNGHHFKTPPLTNLLQIAQIIAIVLFAVAWWTKHEGTSDVIQATQNLAIEGNTKHLDALDKRLDGTDQRAEDARKLAATNSEDLHELMVKFRIMVELVDGNQKQPALHK